MARSVLPPRAAALMESVRGVGYDAKTALADLIDNSIAASAANVWIRFDWAGSDSTVSILDDGVGMNAEELRRAMTLGSQSPVETREKGDLGRFGLGLKSASLSQCSRLVVSSRRVENPVATSVWDLKVVNETNDWIVEDAGTGDEQRFIASLESMPAGTLVLWRNPDRLVGAADSDDAKARLDFQRTSRDVENHLAMTFHRYLDGAHPRLRIFVNGNTEEFRVRAWDPFCTLSTATQQLPEARRGGSNGTVAFQGFVLPHKDRFDADEYDRAGGPAGWTNQQGFYVYRNERLLVPGSWLGLGQPRRWVSDEQHKLARIRLDLPNSLDAEWGIDVRKSKATPPLYLRDWLTRNAEPVRNEAREVFVHRGFRAPVSIQAEFSALWLSSPGLTPSYKINRNHPLVAELLDKPGKSNSPLEKLLRLLESTLPVHRIWLDVAEKPETPAGMREELVFEDVARLASDLLERLMSGQNLSRATAIRRLRNTEPFNQYPEVIAALESRQ